MREQHMIGSGIPPGMVNGIKGTIGTGISAAGTSVSDATALTTDYNVVSTVAAGAGVVLPSGFAGDEVSVLNTGANPLLVYAPSGGTLNGHTADVGAVLPKKSCAKFVYQSTTAVWCFFG